MLPPPIPGAAVTTATAPLSAEDRGLPLEVLRVVRLAVSAARADGALLPAERALILSHAREAGVETVVEDELATSRPLAEIVGGVTDDQKRVTSTCSPSRSSAPTNTSPAPSASISRSSRISSGFDAATAAQLEQDTASKIDALPTRNPRPTFRRFQVPAVPAAQRSVLRRTWNLRSAEPLEPGRGDEMYGSQQWYMAIGGHQVGPVTQDEIIANLRNGSIDAETLVFTAGMANWQKIKDVPAFAPFIGGAGTTAGGAAPPPPTAPGRRAHDIDFVIHGNEMQFVEVELDPGEAAIAEAGVMMYMTHGIKLETIFGDGSKQAERRARRAVGRRQAHPDG